MHTLAAQALMLWNNPALYESRQVYQQISDLLGFLLEQQGSIHQLDSAQHSLLTHLVSASIDAASEAVYKTCQPPSELIETLTGLSELASALQGSIERRKPH